MGTLRQFGSRYRALVASQLATRRLLAKEILGSLEFSCVLAADSETALDALEEGHFDLLLLDERLPAEHAQGVLMMYHMLVANRSVHERPAPAILVRDLDHRQLPRWDAARDFFRVLTTPLHPDILRQAARDALDMSAGAAPPPMAGRGIRRAGS